jgi:cell division protein FtsN
VSEKNSNQEEKQQNDSKEPKVRKSFGNTIILFIIFFIIFTVLVTGVAFFADRFNIGGEGEVKDLAQIDKTSEMTNPEEGESKEYVMDEKGNLKTKEEVEAETAKKAEKTPDTKDVIKPIPELDKKKEAPMPIPRADSRDVPKKEAVKKPAPKPVVKQTPKPKPSPKPAVKSTKGDYVVQLASFKNKSYAVAEQKRLKKMLPDVQVVRVDLGSKGVWYRLRAYVGVSREEANKRSAELARRTKYKPYPMKK